jgi:RNA polymerase sigma-70 factor (sigma-E family)
VGPPKGAELTEAHLPARGRGLSDIQVLYREEAHRCGRLAFLLTGDNELAQELVQEAFVRLMSRWSAIRDRNAIRSYLHRSVVNLAQKSWRKRTNERAYLERHAAREQTVAAPPPDFETRHELQELLRKLPFRQQAAIVLRYYEDLPEREIAGLLGCAVGTVKSALARGLDAMKIELEGDSHE